MGTAPSERLSRPGPLAARAVVAAVWLHQGAWHKLVRRGEDQLEIVRSVPVVGRRHGPALLSAIGVTETVLAAWALSGRAPRQAALAQTALLGAMNAGGLLFGRQSIHDPLGMVLQNTALLTLAWIGAGALAGT